jgi:hypothetical protein
MNLWVGKAFPLYPEHFLVFFEIAVYGRQACDFEGLSLGYERHLLPNERGENLPALVPEKRPDLSEAGPRCLVSLEELVHNDIMKMTEGQYLVFHK